MIKKIFTILAAAILFAGCSSMHSGSTAGGAGSDSSASADMSGFDSSDFDSGETMPAGTGAKSGAPGSGSSGIR